MTMGKWVLGAAALAGCGAESSEGAHGIAQGLYDVEGNVLEDTCGTGQALVGEWRIRVSDGTWMLTDTVAGVSTPGERDGDTLTFTEDLAYNDGGCDFEQTNTATIDPYRDGFTGTFRQDVTAICSGNSCHVLYDVLGIPQ